MNKSTKKAVVLCTVLAMLTFYQPLALLLGSASPFIASHVDKSDGLHHRDAFLPQGWGLRKTVPVITLLSGSLLQAVAVIQHKSALPEPCADGAFAVFVAHFPISGFAYLNNPALRC